MPVMKRQESSPLLQRAIVLDMGDLGRQAEQLKEGARLEAAAIVTGNTVVIKPARSGAATAFKLLELLEEAGVPAGVANYLPGPGSEVGELATALRESDDEEAAREFADVAAWLFTLASLRGIRMSEAVRKYANGCPACGETPCSCIEKG